MLLIIISIDIQVMTTASIIIIKTILGYQFNETCKKNSINSTQICLRLYSILRQFSGLSVLKSGAKLYEFVELEEISSLNMHAFEVHDVIRRIEIQIVLFYTSIVLVK